MSGELLTVLMFAGLLVGLLMGHPLAFVLGGLALIFAYLGPGPQVFGIIINRIYSQMDNYILIAVPMFILMARLLSDSGVTENMFRALRLMLGRVRGGLLFATIAISVVLAATTGVIGASMTVMGVLALPSMVKYGYQKELSTGVIAAGGSLGILIPPSIMLVILGSYAQISVGQLFAAALGPGLLLAGLYALYCGVLTFFRPDLGPPVSEDVVFTHVAVEGQIDGEMRREERSGEFGPIKVGDIEWRAISWTTACSVAAVVEMVSSGALPARGFIKQEEIPLDEYLATANGGLYLS
jgi:TRAP-type mannitol/chloroaromatic compound transport system permease large subunit